MPAWRIVGVWRVRRCRTGSIRCARRAPQIPKSGCRVSALRVTIPRAHHNVPLAGGSRSRVPPSASLCSRSCGCPFNRSRGWRMAYAALRLICPFCLIKRGARCPQAVKTEASKKRGPCSRLSALGLRPAPPRVFDLDGRPLLLGAGQVGCIGHASLRTTAIYGDVIGPEERAFAARMWHGV